jgi:hypothetical protein
MTVAIVSPARSRDRRLGESPQEVAAMGGPDEPLGHDRVALVIDLEAPGVHEPRPGALDDPAFGEHLEATGVNSVDDFDSDVMVAAVLDEGALEPRVAPELGEARGAVASSVRHRDAADVVRRARRHDDYGHEESESVHDAEGLAAVNLLSGVKSLGFLAHRGRGADRAGINDAGRRCAVSPLSFAHRLGETLGDAFPGAVSRPFKVVTMHRVPVRIAIWKRPPLTACCHHVEDGVDHAAAIHLDRSAHRPRTPIRRDEIGDEPPLLVGHVAVCCSPGLRHCNRVGLHGKRYAITDSEEGYLLNEVLNEVH